MLTGARPHNQALALLSQLLLVRLLFTDAYVAATPYFQVFLLMMVRQCFVFSTPLRSVEDNKSFAHANLIALFINAGLIVALMPKYGLWAPARGRRQRPRAFSPPVSVSSSSVRS